MYRMLIGVTALFLSSQVMAANEMPPAAALCGSFHGPTGMGIEPIAPRIAGLSSEYIVKQIHLFQQGDRQNPSMTPMAMTVQGEAINQVADYFAAQPLPAFTPVVRGSQTSYQSAAETLVYQGDWQRTLPACVSCHGPSGIGGGQFPRLAGQQASYLKTQLMAWQSGTRKGDIDNMMGNIASKLSQDEIAALADYFATLK